MKRAVSSISNASNDELIDKCHEIGGALGFYTYLHEGSEVLTFSRWLRANPNTDKEIVGIKKAKILEMLLETLQTRESEATL